MDFSESSTFEAGWGSLVQPAGLIRHYLRDPEIGGSNPPPATKFLLEYYFSWHVNVKRAPSREGFFCILLKKRVAFERHVK